MTEAAQKLAHYMSQLSEDGYCAGWAAGLEYELWWFITEHGPTPFGNIELTAAHIQRLREMSESCGGWIYFHRHDGETFIPLSEWLKMYEQEKRRWIL